MDRKAVARERALNRVRRRLDTIDSEIAEINADEITPDEWLLVRARLGQLMANFNDSVGDIDRQLDTRSAQGRILRYLQIRLGEKVTKDELSGVAGIYEWARRVRELRQDHGWAIHSSVTRDDLRVGEYRLEAATPNEDLARDWETARRMRKLRTSGGLLPPRTRVLEFFKAVHPRAVDREQLAHVAGSGKAAMDAIAGLRGEGWDIVDVAEDTLLTPGEWRLRSVDL